VAKTLSAGAVVIKGRGEARRYLILRAYRNWDFPKGHVEPGEDPLAAAVREVEEETTLTDLSFPWGYAFRETAPYSRGKVARYYLAASAGRAVCLPVSAELGRPEHDEFRWVDYQEAAQLLPPRLQPILEWAEAATAD
jgi:bis(5'-nucleosidyl)-tetraphosphatase